MRSDRLDALARILVRYSTRVRPGDLCVIDAPAFCDDFIVAVSREILRAGGHPLARIELDGVTGRLSVRVDNNGAYSLRRQEAAAVYRDGIGFEAVNTVQ